MYLIGCFLIDCIIMLGSKENSIALFKPFKSFVNFRNFKIRASYTKFLTELFINFLPGILKPWQPTSVQIRAQFSVKNYLFWVKLSKRNKIYRAKL